MRHLTRSLIYTALLATLIASTSHARGLKDLFDNLPIDNNIKTIGNGVVAASEDIKEPEEIQMGNDMAAMLLGAAPLVRQNEAQRYVNEVGRWIALQSDRPNLPWRFGILDTLSVNAFAAPGGKIFITRGLFLRLNNEAELAGVLAHEIAHVMRKHHLAAIKKKGMMQAGSSLLSNYSNRQGGAVPEQFQGLFKGVMTSALDKDDEFDADRVGVVLATRAGYNPFGLPSVLQGFAAAGKNDKGFEMLFSTHPAPSERLERLSNKMENRFDRWEDDSNSDDVRLRKIQRLVR